MGNSNKDHKAHIHLMLDAFKKVLDFTHDVSYEIFLKDSKTQSAVIMQMEVIGQLVKKLPLDIKKDIDLPWKKMTGMRDMIAHDYFGLDLMTIWNTVIDGIPDAQIKIKKYLDEK